jgi:hypothetical protein
MLTPKIST